MTEAERAFRAISWLIIKWLLICLAGLIGLAALCVGAYFAHHWYTYDRHVPLITSSVAAAPSLCSPEFPLFVSFANKSSRTINRVSFTLSAKVPGRSSDIASYASLSNDTIIKPGEVIGHCWGLPRFTVAVKDYMTLEWSLIYLHYTFAD